MSRYPDWLKEREAIMQDLDHPLPNCVRLARYDGPDWVDKNQQPRLFDYLWRFAREPVLRDVLEWLRTADDRDVISMWGWAKEESYGETRRRWNAQGCYPHNPSMELLYQYRIAGLRRMLRRLLAQGHKRAVKEMRQRGCLTLF